MMTPLLERLDKLRPVIERICRTNRVQLLYLFGSQARSQALPFSDVDFGVAFKHGVSREDENRAQIQLITELMGLLRRDDVQMVLLQRAGPLLKHRAATEGLVLHQEPGAHADFLVKALREYDDTRSLREATAEALRRRYARR